MTKLPVNFTYDLSKELQGQQLISSSLDDSGRLFVLTTSEDVIYREKNETSPRLQTQKPHDFVVTEVTPHYSASYTIPNQYWNFHQVQPLADDELLLVCSRARFRTYEDYDLNASVFTLDGLKTREFLLGDGIQDVQTTHDGMIWTSYIDEGVLGNHDKYGWRHPIGAAGLVQWDRYGSKLYEFQPTSGVGTITDCYALNVINSTELWIYYYTEFPLVKIVQQRVADYWMPPIRGSSHFAVWQQYVLFYGNYDDRLLRLYELSNDHKLVHIADFEGLESVHEVITRSNHLLFREGHHFYQLDMADLVTSYG